MAKFRWGDFMYQKWGSGPFKNVLCLQKFSFELKLNFILLTKNIYRENVKKFFTTSKRQFDQDLYVVLILLSLFFGLLRLRMFCGGLLCCHFACADIVISYKHIFHFVS